MANLERRQFIDRAVLSRTIRWYQSSSERIGPRQTGRDHFGHHQYRQGTLSRGEVGERRDIAP